MLDIFYEGMNNISTTFGREVTPVIRDVMERFNCGTEDKRFLEFDDRTGEALRDYNATVDCMRLPDGRIVEEYPAPQWHKFIIKDGKVYQRHAGPLHHPKRTKAAKNLTLATNTYAHHNRTFLGWSENATDTAASYKVNILTALYVMHAALNLLEDTVMH